MIKFRVQIYHSRVPRREQQFQCHMLATQYFEDCCMEARNERGTFVYLDEKLDSERRWRSRRSFSAGQQ